MKTILESIVNTISIAITITIGIIKLFAKGVYNWLYALCLTESKIYSGVDVIVGTPGRISDFLEKGTLKLTELKHLVLDEVDRMLDMGFAEKVEEILAYAYNKGKRNDIYLHLWLIGRVLALCVVGHGLESWAGWYQTP